MTDVLQKKNRIAWEIKLVKLPEYWRSWNTSKTEGSYFDNGVVMSGYKSSKTG